jgi:hypothetical protein
MSGFLDWLGQSGLSLGDSLRSIGDYLPLFFAALGLLAVGWLAARLLRAIVVKSGAGLGLVLDRLGRSAGTRGLQLSPKLVALVGNVLFWVTILLFAALAARVARLDAFSGGLDRVVAYLPTLIAGGLIILAGYLVSGLIRDLVSAAFAGAGSAQNELFGLAAQGAVFLTAVVVGLDQIGIDVTFLMILLAVVVAGLLLSLALAFGSGSRTFVGNLIAAHHVRQLVEPGQLLRVGDIQGRLLEISPTCAILLTDTGRVLLPAKLFQEQATIILAEGDDE